MKAHFNKIGHKKREKTGLFQVWQILKIKTFIALIFLWYRRNRKIIKKIFVKKYGYMSFFSFLCTLLNSKN